MSTNPTTTKTAAHLRSRARTWQGIAAAWTAVAIQHTLAGAGIRQRYKTQRDRAIRAALLRGVPVEPLANRLRLATNTVRAIKRGERTAE
ncbi:hypothetical protein [Kitasatospora indigofera]|uniref:hypothetical protein n=1 Tax=Kitasatospora indigofera TaxID=67307 RepID=UPI00367DAAAF